MIIEMKGRIPHDFVLCFGNEVLSFLINACFLYCFVCVCVCVCNDFPLSLERGFLLTDASKCQQAVSPRINCFTKETAGFLLCVCFCSGKTTFISILNVDYRSGILPHENYHCGLEGMSWCHQ